VDRVIRAIKKLLGKEEPKSRKSRWIKLDDYVVCPNCRKVVEVRGYLNFNALDYLRQLPVVYRCSDGDVGVCLVDDEGVHVVVNEGGRLQMVKVRTS